MTKLHVVRIEFAYVIAVEDGENKYDVAADTLREAVSDVSTSDFDYQISDVESIKDVTQIGYDSTSYPYSYCSTASKIGVILERNKNGNNS